MKVILKNKIKNLGEFGDIIVVKDGYARNFLIPRGYAIFYSEANYKSFGDRKEDIAKENAANIDEASRLEKALSKLDIIILENASDDGKLYGSVSTVRLASLLNDMLKIKTIKRHNIEIEEVIRNIGKYQITVALHPEVSFVKDVIIARTKEEAQKIKSGEWEEEQRRKARERLTGEEPMETPMADVQPNVAPQDYDPNRITSANQKRIEKKNKAKEEKLTDENNAETAVSEDAADLEK